MLAKIDQAVEGFAVGDRKKAIERLVSILSLCLYQRKPHVAISSLKFVYEAAQFLPECA